MGRALRLGRWAGIDVFMHVTFPLILVWFGLTAWLQTREISAALGSIAFIAALFVGVVLHEYGHALMARRFGIGTRDITLLPIGGVARLERMPEKPSQELLVALAGPAVNLVLAVGLVAAWAVAQPMGGVLAPVGDVVGFVQRLALLNVFLAVFNLLPAFPMDGGRVVRALLATRLDYARATGIAASLGKGMAVLFAIVGLLANPFLLLIALFVWFGASQEAQAAQTRAALRGLPVTRAMMTRFDVLPAWTPVRQAVDDVMASGQDVFPVVDGGRLTGVLAREDLVQALKAGNADARVGDITQRDFRALDADAMLETAAEALQTGDAHAVPVLDGDRVIGLLTPRNLMEFVAVRAVRA